MNTPLPLRVFVVEDNAETLKWLEIDLRAAGYYVTTAQTVSEALLKLPESKSDVLLSDIGLPDGTGWDLLGRLKDSAPFLSIAMSGFGTPEDASRSRQAGFSDHLVKPFDPARLHAILQGAAESLGQNPNPNETS